MTLKYFILIQNIVLARYLHPHLCLTPVLKSASMQKLKQALEKPASVRLPHISARWRAWPLEMAARLVRINMFLESIPFDGSTIYIYQAADLFVLLKVPALVTGPLLLRAVVLLLHSRVAERRAEESLILSFRNPEYLANPSTNQQIYV